MAFALILLWIFIYYRKLSAYCSITSSQPTILHGKQELKDSIKILKPFLSTS